MQQWHSIDALCSDIDALQSGNADRLKDVLPWHDHADWLVHRTSPLCMFYQLSETVGMRAMAALIQLYLAREAQGGAA